MGASSSSFFPATTHQRQSDIVPPREQELAARSNTMTSSSSSADGSDRSRTASTTDVDVENAQQPFLKSAGRSRTALRYERQALLEDVDRRVAKLVDSVERRVPAKRRFKSHLALAISVGFAVMLVSMPVFVTELHYMVFGQRGKQYKVEMEEMNKTASSANGQSAGSSTNATQSLQHLQVVCGDQDYGRMRNMASIGELPRLRSWSQGSPEAWDPESNPGDLWCGWLPAIWATHSSHAAQFTLFVVAATTGSTMKQGYQGVLGTFMGLLNVHMLQLIFPSGAHGHRCGPRPDHSDDGFVVISYNMGEGGWVEHFQPTFDAAVKAYEKADSGGIVGRAIFHADGTVDSSYHEFGFGWEPKFQMRFQEMAKEDCEPGEMVYDDPNYASFGEAVCVLDFLLVLFLFLLSSCSTMTTMFAVSSHVTSMMSFMDPHNSLYIYKTSSGAQDPRNWFEMSYAVVEMTTLVGAVVATCATLIPRSNLRNLDELFSDGIVVTDSVVSVWREATEYLCSGERSAARLRLESRIESLELLATAVKRNLDGGWWEVLGRPRARRRRDLLALYHANAESVQEMTAIVKFTVLTEQFAPAQQQFFEMAGEVMNIVVKETSTLMWLCLQASEDGVIDDWERDEIQMLVDSVRERQDELEDAYLTVAPSLGWELAEAHTFLFGLSIWTRRMAEMADFILIPKESEPWYHGSLRFFQTFVEAGKGAWSPAKILAPMHLKSSCQNWLSIAVCFLLGCYADHGIFTPRNPTMASTLAFLLVTDNTHQVEHSRSLNRLLGVVLGTCLPIIITASYGVVPCGSVARNILQGLSIFLFVSVFSFGHFDSKMWGFVSYLIGCFGIVGLVGPCKGTASEFEMVEKYQEIGNVVVAILIQGCIHGLSSCSGPRESMEEQFRHLCRNLSRGFSALSSSDIDALQDAIATASSDLSEMRALASQCDPRIQLYQGLKVEFRMDLCNRLIMSFQDVLSELQLLVVATTEWHRLSPATEGCSRREHDVTMSTLQRYSGRDIEQVIQERIAKAVACLEEVAPSMMGLVARDKVLKDEPVLESSLPILKSLRPMEKLYRNLLEFTKDQEPDGPGTISGIKLSGEAASQKSMMPSMPTCEYHEDHVTDNVRLRLVVIIRALERTMYHLGKMGEECLKESVQPQVF